MPSARTYSSRTHRGNFSFPYGKALEKSDGNEFLYEVGNHLGNVLTVVSDKKIPVSDGMGGIDYYKADVVSATDYYPFGSPMPGRNFSSTEYRYGFNGKEKDDETQGSGNTYDYGERIYNSRIGRFLSVDPLFSTFPYLTPYQFAENTPIVASDLDGLEAKLGKPTKDKDGNTVLTITVSINVINNANVSPEELSRFKTGLQTELNRVFQQTTADKRIFNLVVEYNKDATINLVLNPHAEPSKKPEQGLIALGVNLLSGRGSSQVNTLLINVTDLKSNAERIVVAVQEVMNTIGLQDEQLKDKKNVAVDYDLSPDQGKFDPSTGEQKQTLETNQRELVVNKVSNEQNISRKERRELKNTLRNVFNSDFKREGRRPAKF